MIGLISDTHGLMRQEALTALKGTDLIIHAGDVGTPGIIEQLRAVARVVALEGTLIKALLPMTAVAEAGSLLV